MTRPDYSTPVKTARGKAVRLTKILETHAAWERRTLADLRVAGFKFTSIEQAFRYWQAQKTLARMTHDDLIEFVAKQQTTNKEAS